MGALQKNALVTNRQAQLPLKHQAGLVQFVAEALLIRGLEQPGSQLAMNLNRAPEDSPTQRIDSRIVLGHSIGRGNALAKRKSSTPAHFFEVCEPTAANSEMSGYGEERSFCQPR